MCLILDSNHEWLRMVGYNWCRWSSNPKLPFQYCQEMVDEQTSVKPWTLSAQSGSLSQANMTLVKHGETGILLNFLLFWTHLDSFSNWLQSCTGSGYGFLVFFVGLLGFFWYVFFFSPLVKLIPLLSWYDLRIRDYVQQILQKHSDHCSVYPLRYHQSSFHCFCIRSNSVVVKLLKTFLLLDLSRETTVTCTVASVQWCKPSNRTVVGTRKRSPMVNLSDMRQKFSKSTDKQVAKEMLRIWPLQLKVAWLKSQFLN